MLPTMNRGDSPPNRLELEACQPERTLIEFLQLRLKSTRNSLLVLAAVGTIGGFAVGKEVGSKDADPAVRREVARQRDVIVAQSIEREEIRDAFISFAEQIGRADVASDVAATWPDAQREDFLGGP